MIKIGNKISTNNISTKIIKYLQYQHLLTFENKNQNINNKSKNQSQFLIGEQHNLSQQRRILIGRNSLTKVGERAAETVAVFWKDSLHCSTVTNCCLARLTSSRNKRAAIFLLDVKGHRSENHIQPSFSPSFSLFSPLTSSLFFSMYSLT